jgi:hypothetical protein
VIISSFDGAIMKINSQTLTSLSNRSLEFQSHKLKLHGFLILNCFVNNSLMLLLIGEKQDCIIIVKKNWFDDPRLNCTWHTNLKNFMKVFKLLTLKKIMI